MRHAGKCVGYFNANLTGDIAPSVNPDAFVTLMCKLCWRSFESDSVGATADGAAAVDVPPLKPSTPREGGLKRQSSVDSMEDTTPGSETNGAKRARRDSLEGVARKNSLDGIRCASAEPSKVRYELIKLKLSHGNHPPKSL